jgi:hypothetical protein
MSFVKLVVTERYELNTVGPDPVSTECGSNYWFLTTEISLGFL